MATHILRTVDRWRFEVPLALTLAAAAGFATLAMPHEIFARVPVASQFGQPGHAVLAVAAALILGALGYVAMRRPARPVVADADAYIDDIDAPMVVPDADAAEDGPVRIRRADRHPDAPPRAPIRASRDLGEPFMEIGTPAASADEPEWRFIEEPAADRAPIATDDVAPHSEAADIAEVVDHPADPVDAEAADATAVAEDDSVAHLAEPVEPVAQIPAVTTPAAEPAGRPISRAPRMREDTSLEAMIERLSSKMPSHAEPVGRPFGLAETRKPALRDALDRLNRLAERRG